MTKRPLRETPQAKIDAFYASRQWKRLSYEAKKLFGKRCQCCGAGPKRAIINTDHIKPIRYYWELRLEIGNLQVLCEDCNKGKGSWDETDHRPIARSVGNILFGNVNDEAAKTRLKKTIIEQYSRGDLTEDQAIKMIRANDLVHA